jgi:hypothetical protein
MVRRRRPLNVYPVFIRAGKKEGVEAALPFVAGDGVGDDGRVKVPKVREAVGVVDRCRYVESRHLWKN